MNRILEILNIIGVKKILVGIAFYIIGIALLYFLAIYRFQDVELEQNQKLTQLKENYIQIKSVNYNKLLSALDEETTRLGKKVKLLEKAILAEEAVPYFVSNLEREAIASGLKIKSTFRREDPPKKSKKKSKKAELILTLDFTGTYSQTVSFLKRLEQWSSPVFVKSFSLLKLKGNNKQIKGILNCPILEKKNS